METDFLNIRYACPDDAEKLAEIISETSEGVVEHLFSNLVPFLKAEKILATALMKGESPYLSENMTLLTYEENIIALLFSYPAKDHFIPLLMENFISDKRLKIVRPILETAVPNSLYINTIWIEEQLRGQGFSALLMKRALQNMEEKNCNGISLFCWNDNKRALTFYKKNNFKLYKEIPAKEIPIKGHDEGGVLLYKAC
ncbi:GNAT family N-acetyltransferase [Desulfovibrio litoralis]|uniref:Acetyltransferase (GNAT) domain-containing protein n=1 Tax=Desulfovibrio litoralis DSM 11393 TaxID=1121455 RepID=A0A1M7TMW8_9BACT|nr:GNAT family N-acetyltransferase [Desulfovibrio litoralis]SHN72067.1 Acetyltransferase (GNAT) domain-containing protein [Desulfovibrio litoralis DSM 11393]